MAIWLILPLLSSLTAGGAQEEPAPGVETPAAQSDRPPREPQSGLWPSQRLLELMIVRWAEEASSEYELDDEQRAEVREAAVKRWSDFAEQHETELQPLLNEFLEMRLGLEPPAKDRVQDWAGRSLPVFEQLRDELHKSTDDLRRMMRPEQRAKLEVEVFKHRAGLQLAENKLRHWSQGNIDPDDLWEPVGESRRERRERRREREKENSEAEAAAKPAKREDQITLELATWERYVQAFVAAYGLDEAQRATALSCLKELQERAGAHREAHRAEIEKLETQIKGNTGIAEEQKAIKEQLVLLYGPVDEMFQELKTRLDGILTIEQRARVKFTFPPDSAGADSQDTPKPTTP